MNWECENSVTCRYFVQEIRSSKLKIMGINKYLCHILYVWDFFANEFYQADGLINLQTKHLQKSLSYAVFFPEKIPKFEWCNSNRYLWFSDMWLSVKRKNTRMTVYCWGEEIICAGKNTYHWSRDKVRFLVTFHLSEYHTVMNNATQRLF